MEKLFKYLFLGAMLFVVLSCTEDPQPQVPAPTLVEAANAAGLTALLQAVEAVPGLGSALLSADAITVFAPTNQAFSAALSAFGAANLGELVDAIGGVNNLEVVLGFHVVPTVAFSSNLNATNNVSTLSGQNLTINRSGNTVTVVDAAGNTATVIAADVVIENGVVHVIDRVLLPGLNIPQPPAPNLVAAAQAAGLSTLLTTVTAVDGLADALLSANAITVFAPTNGAFEAALQAFKAANLIQLVTRIGGLGNLESVLGFHVVPAVAFSGDLNATNTFTTLGGQQLTVTKQGTNVRVTDALGNTVNVVAADVAIENGVVHVIDGVLLPELSIPNVVEAAASAGLTVLLDAVTAANLGGVLLGAEAITVFAPTNAAFGNLLEALSLNSLGQLVEALGIEAVTKVLGYHVVPAVAFSFDLAEGSQTVPTLAGEQLTVTKSSTGVTVTDTAGNTFNVIAADVAIANGVVHVINGVVLPNLN